MRLIDADALKDYFCGACSTKKRYKRTNAECRANLNASYGYSCFKMRLIDSAPTIDAEPVRHGCEWCNGEYHTELSAHGVRYHTSDKSSVYVLDVNFCPVCGARTDLEVEHDLQSDAVRGSAESV